MNVSHSHTGNSKYLLVFSLLVLILTVSLDQVTKNIITSTIPLGQSIPTTGLFRLTHVTNTGSAFGLFTNQTTLLTFASILGVGVLLLFHYSHQIRTLFVHVCLGLQLGGAVGNLCDRIILGHVIDFIDVGIWPIFNIADSAIVIGLLGLMLTLIFAKSKKEGIQVCEKETSVVQRIVQISQESDEKRSNE